MIDDALLDYIDGKWCLNGVPYSGETKDFGDVWHYLNGDYHREDGPAYEGADGSKAWYIHGKRHREDGPAYEGTGGNISWWIHGKQHREDGPAIEFADGRKEWWIRDEKILTWKQYHKLSTLSPQEQMVVKLRYGEELK